MIRTGSLYRDIKFSTYLQGLLIAADSTPTGVLRRNNSDTATVVTVTSGAVVGEYFISFTTDAAWSETDHVTVDVEALIDLSLYRRRKFDSEGMSVAENAAIIDELAVIAAKTGLIRAGFVNIEGTVINGKIPILVRGDDYNTATRLIKHAITAPTDAGSAASCSVIFAGWHPDIQKGWRVTGGVAEDIGGGQWEIMSTMVKADTIDCPPSPGYEWTHTLIDASGNIQTKVFGTTKLIDGYAVERFVE